MAYRPIDVARAIGVSVSTVRNWTRDYGEHLSPAARGESGHREFSAVDLEIMRFIAGLRADNATREQILDRLASTTFGEPEEVAPQPSPEKPAQVEAPAQLPTAPGDIPGAVLQLHAAQLERIAGAMLERDTAQARAVRAEVAQLRTWLYVLAAVVALLIVAVLLLAVFR